MPTTPDTLAAAITPISIHDHVCLIYGSRAEQFAAIAPFIRHGLNAGERCVYFADDDVEEVLGALRGDGIDTAAETARGALQILSRREAYLRDRHFDPDAMIAALGEMTAAARADGFAALRVTGEMTWALDEAPGSERLSEYESRLNRFFADHDAVAICQYDRSRFGPEAILDVLRTHPVVITGDTVCHNPYYVPRDEPLKAGGAAREVERLLTAIRDTERSRRALERASRSWSATFDAITDMVCLLAADGTVLRCNRSMAHLLGREYADVVGRKCYELMHGRGAFLEHCPVARMLKTGRSESFELPLGDRWCQVTADPLLDEGGEIVGAVHIVRDLTDRKESEDALRASEARARFWTDVVEAASEAIVIGYPDGRLGDFNEAWCDLTGYGREELRTIDWARALTPPEWFEREHEALAELQRTGLPALYEKEILRKDGSRVPVELLVQLGRGGGAGVYFIGFVTDISARKRTEATIRHLNEDLERRVRARTRELTVANKNLQQFVYSVSHDLRTPLRAVDGFSLAVLDAHGDALGVDGRNDLRRVRSAAQRLGQLIDALLSLANVGRRTPRLEETDLSAIARHLVRELRDDEPEREVEIAIQDGLVAETDAVLTEVVLANLLGNAWKFSACRTVAHITVGAESRDGRLAFFVSDDGVGFDPAFAHKLFTPFESLHAPGEFTGTGVGLATVARTLESLGGTCWAEGRPGGGATFYFVLAEANAEK